MGDPGLVLIEKAGIKVYFPDILQKKVLIVKSGPSLVFS